MAALGDTFSRFSDLSPELREEIWRLCLPHRIQELGSADTSIAFDNDSQSSQGTPPCRLTDPSFMNGVFPVISQVSRGSRAIALKAATASGLLSDLPYNWENGLAYKDKTRISPHLNWTALDAMDYYSLTDPMQHLSEEATRTSGQASLMVQYFRYGWEFHEFPMLDQRHRDNAAVATELRKLSEYLMVVQTIVIHSDFRAAAATGLFGLLGVAPIQIIDMADEAKVSAFYDLAQDCEEAWRRKGPLTVEQYFSKCSCGVMQQRLRDMVMFLFGDERLAASFRPAVMFRLCMQACNSVEGERRRAKIEARRQAAMWRLRGTRGRDKGRGRGRGS